jgi:hypothetical protein
MRIAQIQKNAIALQHFTQSWQQGRKDSIRCTVLAENFIENWWYLIAHTLIFSAVCSFHYKSSDFPGLDAGYLPMSKHFRGINGAL